MIPSLTLYKLKLTSKYWKTSNDSSSLIPSIIRQWNSLDQSLRNVDSIAKFKAELRKLKDINQVPKHYEIGPKV
jgi:hypothetical protein